MSEIVSYNLGERVINGIDVQLKQPNYIMKYGKEALENQREFTRKLGIGKFYENRVVMAISFGNKILSIKDLSNSGYETNSKSRCQGYDGAITSIPNIPIFVGWGDCPWLLVSDGTTIGTVHATRDTLDLFILDNFFETFFKKTKTVSPLNIGFSPYIPSDLFEHERLDMKRADAWKDTKSVDFREGRYYLNLKKMILSEIKRLNVPIANIHDAELSTWEMSRKSHEQGGYSVSHRFTRRYPDSQEGRGAFCMMLRES